MKWIGQHIFDLIARFRSSVIMENLPGEAPTHFLGINASNEVVKGAVSSSTIKAGIVELATTAETTTGTSETLAVTPDGLKDGYQGSTNVTTLGTIATGVWNGTAISQAYVGAEAINESKLQVSNAPVNGYMLTAQSGDTGGLTWAAAPSDTNTNIANTDLTATNNRTLDLDSNDLTFSNVAELTLNAQSTTINGQFAAIKSGADAPDFRIYEDSDHGTNFGKFTLGALGADRTYTLPDATGTVALTSDIPTGNSIIDWTGASAGTIHSTNIPTLNQNTTGSAATLTTARNIGGVSFNGSANIDLPGVNETGNQDTSGNAATATALTTGNKDITGTLNVKSSTTTGNPFMSFSQTTTRRAFIQLADNTQGFENHMRIASEYGPVSIASAATAGSDTDTAYFMVQPTGTFRFGAADSDAVLTTDGSMAFRIDADDDETSQKFSFQNNDTTEIASISESGDLSVSGAITGKQIQIFNMNFADDLNTTEHYIPFKDINEQTSVYQEEAAMVMPFDGRVKSITYRMSAVGSTGNATFRINTRPVGTTPFTSSTDWDMEESETVAIASDDDHHVHYFAFDNAKHFDSGELLCISLQYDADINSGFTYHYVTAVIEFDLNNGLGTGTSSAEYDSNQ